MQKVDIEFPANRGLWLRAIGRQTVMSRSNHEAPGANSWPVIDRSDMDPIEVPIDGCLDLHTFNPRELKRLIPDYLDECAAQGILEVRIVHGKGRGTLRRSVHAILQRLPIVLSYASAPAHAGGWGATIVALRPHGTSTTEG